MTEQTLRIGRAVKPSAKYKQMFPSVRPRTTGKIIGESRTRDCWLVAWPEVGHIETLHAKFLRVYPHGECGAKEGVE